MIGKYIIFKHGHQKYDLEAQIMDKILVPYFHNFGNDFQYINVYLVKCTGNVKQPFPIHMGTQAYLDISEIKKNFENKIIQVGPNSIIEINDKAL